MIVKKYINDNNLNLKYLLNTHGHIDHIAGCAFIKNQFDAQFYFPEKDIDLFEHYSEQAKAFGFEIKNLPIPDVLISENTNLKIGNSPVNFLFTPGHTQGEYCFYFKREAFCITGDVLFRNNIGRTDLYGGDYEKLIYSIKTQLFNLPDNVLIYPGHGEDSKIGIEKVENPFLHDIKRSYN
jgi:glyoxylase-like metal-dependent hydrolase (beta-lactamase superfamily II)